MKRYYSLQILRAFAAWLVVGSHFMQMFYNYQHDSVFGWFFVRYGGFGIDLFFVLSGFVMFLNAKQPTAAAPSFFVKRVTRIMPAYWFFTTLFIAWVAMFPFVFSYTDYTPLSLLKSYLLIPGENPTGIGVMPFLTPGWSLIYEFVFYSLLSLCLLMNRKYAVEICFVLIAIMPFVFPDGLTYSPVLGSWVILQFLFGFIIGWYLSSPLLPLVNRIFPWWLQVAGLFAIAVVALSGVVGGGVGPRTIASTSLVMAFIVLDDHLNYKDILSRFLIRSGDYSYSVYLSHVPVIGLWLSIRGVWAPQTWDWAYLIAICVTTHAVSALSFRWVERGGLVKRTKTALLDVAGRVEGRIYARA